MHSLEFQAKTELYEMETEHKAMIITTSLKMKNMSNSIKSYDLPAKKLKVYQDNIKLLSSELTTKKKFKKLHTITREIFGTRFRWEAGNLYKKQLNTKFKKGITKENFVEMKECRVTEWVEYLKNLYTEDGKKWEETKKGLIKGKEMLRLMGSNIENI